MELKDYTTEELKAELKRRQMEARKLKDNKAQYIYATAVVTHASGSCFSLRHWDVELTDESMKELNLHHTRKNISSIYVNKLKIKAGDSPKVGDMVKVQCRITKSAQQPFFWRNKIRICEVIKRAE